MPTFTGTSGDDYIPGTSDADIISGLGGNDMLFGDTGDDEIDGGAGNDELYGGAGADNVSGGPGDDWFYLSVFDEFAAGDTVGGGSGYDRLSLFNITAGFNLSQIAYSGIEALYAQPSPDGLGITVAELNGFSAVQGDLRVIGSGAVTLGSVALGEATNLFLGDGITAFTFTSATGVNVGVYAGANGVTITGGAGQDGLVGGAGADVLIGGAGTDSLIGSTGDHLLGGADDDALYLSGSSGAGIVVDGGTGTNVLNITSVDSGFSLDQLTVSNIARLGADQVHTSVTALAQFPQIHGSYLITGSGTVALPAIEMINQTVFTLTDGLSGLDMSAASYTGTNTSVTVIAVGNAADNIITGTAGANQLDGLGGNDTLNGGDVYDSLAGGDGDDLLFGNGGGDHLRGGAGRDEVHGGAGDDALYVLGLASDVVAGELYDGGDGFDTLSIDAYQSPPGSVVDLTGVTLVGIEALGAGTAAPARIRTTQLAGLQRLGGAIVLADNVAVSLAGFELGGATIQLADGGQTLNATGSTSSFYTTTIRGGSGNDTITAGAYAQSLYGGSGNDVLTSSANGGQLYGDAGDDRLVFQTGGVAWGGDGFDTLVANGAVWMNTGPAAITGMEAIELGGGSLQMLGYQFKYGFAANTMITGNGTIRVELQSEVIGGALVSTHFITSQMTVSSGISFVITGTSGVDVVKVALTAAVTVDGGGGTDQIRGSNLADTLFGGDDNDKLMGLGGADTLTGGTGSDQFRYLFASDSTLGASDRILDFTNGSDRLDFRALDADPVAAGRQTISFVGTAAFAANGTAQARYADSGSDTLVQIDLNGDGAADMQIVLVGHAGQALAAADFLF